MKGPRTVSITDCIDRLAGYDAILDARSPGEFAIDHLPGASSAPVLDDLERIEVGTLHARAGAFAARRRGAALVARNIAGLLEARFHAMPPEWRPLVYCWRGGNRSASLAIVLSRVGWRVDVLEGGYRAYRRRVVADIERLPARLRFIVVAGRTGVGKSRLLQLLAARGQQVLDLEAMAAHRGSVLGPMPDSDQPSQKAFESRLWQALRGYDEDRPVFVESESRKIGQCQVPGPLIERMRASECVVIAASPEFRIRLLREEYEHFLDDPSLLARRLSALAPLHGKARLAHWESQARLGDWDGLVGDLLAAHYDPAYERSMARNFLRLDEARLIDLEAGPEGSGHGNASPDCDAALARAADRLAALDASTASRPPIP